MPSPYPPWRNRQWLTNQNVLAELVSQWSPGLCVHEGACDVSTGKGEVTAARGWSNKRRRWNAVRCRGEQLKRQQRLVKHTRVSSQTVSFSVTHTHAHAHAHTHTHTHTHTFLCDRQFHSAVAEVLAYKKQCWYDLMGESYYKTVAGPV